MRKMLLVCLVLLALGIVPVLAQDAEPTAEPSAETNAAATDARTPAQVCDDATPAPEPETRQFEQPEQVLEAGVDYRAVFCTDAGAIYIDLLEDYAPATVNSFVFLADQGYYNNTTFHRVLQDFMAQGGDPTATGTGGPGYTIPDEYVGFLYFDRPGWLAMANTGQPNSGGSQFFITTVPYPSLNFGYTIFGEVLEGQENVDAIELRDPDTATEPGTALNTVVIVTDPASIDSTYEAPTPATEEDLAAVIDELNANLPEQLAPVEAITGTFDAKQVAATAPEAIQSDYADFLAAHNFEFRAGHGVDNVDCALDSIPFVTVGYTLDRFATPEDASAALSDGFLDELAQAEGYTASTVEGMDYPVYTQSTTACDTDAVMALTYWQRGHFVVTASVTFPNNEVAPPEIWLTNLVGVSVYEPTFSEALRAEIR